MANPHKACFLSLKELSREIPTTETTFMKFTRKVNYGSFIELKKELRTYMEDKISPPKKLQAVVGGGEDEAVKIKQVIDTEFLAMKKTIEHLNPDQVRNAVQMIKKASKVFLIGMGISKPVVELLAMRLKLIGIETEIFEVTSYNIFSLQILKLRPTDLFIVVSFPRHWKMASMFIDYLGQKKHKMIVLTDSLSSPLARHARLVFLCYSDAYVFYNSITPAIAVANLLTSILALGLKNELVKSLEKVKEVEERFFAEDYYSE
jgi:DNA-binding MurR/RpiR family transcriptional regulator